MSTRCAMIVMSKEFYGGKNGDYKTQEVLRAYRHCDGYPEGMGLDIAWSCMMADEWPNEGVGWLNKNNRNWCQAFLHCIMRPKADIEVEPMGYEHGDIEYLYVVEGTRDLSWGKVPVKSYNINIKVYSPSEWDEGYSKIMKEEPLFDGSWKDMIEWLGVTEERLRRSE